ncbi:hypothetical protein I7I50_00478 [Histoplasma capsulatum G186AR]|uniref:Uncharacterized protein n=1 Tax=Ajellomyces capsulatus TaxID=5037 RepID=A0A8H8CU17_AJECA|nr:hypothetical protein I7I52_07746 [Histoplasma capsulatum]QSS72584.1 hypothetical protein I7I50_00478 [Histoplasma capsulatum G186AR]
MTLKYASNCKARALSSLFAASLSLLSFAPSSLLPPLNLEYFSVKNDHFNLCSTQFFPSLQLYRDLDSSSRA